MDIESTTGLGEHWLDGVAPLIVDPPPANSTTMHSRLVRHVGHLCFDQNTLFARSGKMAVTFKPMMHFKNPSGFRRS